jgi:hypothetical protein
MYLFDAFGEWLRTGVHDAWAWVQRLDLQGWLLLLAAATAAGFLCMRGFGSRSQY